jgi:hypothetical protein
MTAKTTASASGAEPFACALFKSGRDLDLLKPVPHAAQKMMNATVSTSGRALNSSQMVAEV